MTIHATLSPCNCNNQSISYFNFCFRSVVAILDHYTRKEQITIACTSLKFFEPHHSATYIYIMPAWLTKTLKDDYFRNYFRTIQKIIKT